MSSLNFDFIAIQKKSLTKLCQFSLDCFAYCLIHNNKSLFLVLVRSADESFSLKFDMHCDRCDFDVDDFFSVPFKSKFKQQNELQ